MSYSVRELDLQQYVKGSAEEKNLFSKALFEGLKDFGFIILKNHSLSEKLMKDSYEVTKSFFDLKSDIKKKYHLKNLGQRGYTPFGKESAKNSSVPDLKEFWHIGRENTKNFDISFEKNVWPEEVPKFRTTLLELYSALDKISFQILEALSKPLDIPKDYFRTMCTQGNTILRLLHYPPLRATDHSDSIRAAAHEDVNLITLLISASASGLELLDRKGQWLPVATDPKNIIIDTGDMMERVTNGLIPSTTHRVVNPKDPRTSRYSIPFFVHPAPDFTLTCLKSCENQKTPLPPISAKQFLEKRLHDIGLSK